MYALLIGTQDRIYIQASTRELQGQLTNKRSTIELQRHARAADGTRTRNLWIKSPMCVRSCDKSAR